MNFIEEIWQIFSLYFSIFTGETTRRAQHAGKITVSIFNSKLA